RNVPACHRKKAALVPHLIVTGLAPARGQGGFNNDMYACATHADLCIAVEGGDTLLCPVVDGASIRVPAVIKIHTGVGVIADEHVTNPPPSIGARPSLLPLFQGHREGCDTLLKGPPGC